MVFSKLMEETTHKHEIGSSACEVLIFFFLEFFLFFYLNENNLIKQQKNFSWPFIYIIFKIEQRNKRSLRNQKKLVYLFLFLFFFSFIGPVTFQQQQESIYFRLQKK